MARDRAQNSTRLASFLDCGQLFGQIEIAGQRVEHMLPRTDGIRIAQATLLPLRNCPHNIRYKTVLGPVAPADHIAGTHGSNGRSTVGQIAFAKRVM